MRAIQETLETKRALLHLLFSKQIFNFIHLNLPSKIDCSSRYQLGKKKKALKKKLLFYNGESRRIIQRPVIGERDPRSKNSSRGGIKFWGMRGALNEGGTLIFFFFFNIYIFLFSSPRYGLGGSHAEWWQGYCIWR